MRSSSAHVAARATSRLGDRRRYIDRRELARAGAALELVWERLAAGLDDPRLAGALALVCRPDSVGDRLRRQQPVASLAELLPESVRRESRVRPAGADSLDPDPALCELGRDGPDEPDDRML